MVDDGHFDALAFHQESRCRLSNNCLIEAIERHDRNSAAVEPGASERKG